MTTPSHRDPLMTEVINTLDYPGYVLDWFQKSNGPDQAWELAQDHAGGNNVTLGDLYAAAEEVIQDHLEKGNEVDSSHTEETSRESGFFPPASGDFPDPRPEPEAVSAGAPKSIPDAPVVDFVASRQSLAILRVEGILRDCRRGRTSAREAILAIHRDITPLVESMGRQDAQDGTSV